MRVRIMNMAVNPDGRMGGVGNFARTARESGTHRVDAVDRPVVAGQRLDSLASGDQSDRVSLSWPREASKRQAQEGDGDGYGRCSNAVPAWHACIGRLEDRCGQRGGSHHADQRVGLHVVGCRLLRGYRDARLVAEVHTVRGVRRAVWRLTSTVVRVCGLGAVCRGQPGRFSHYHGQARVGHAGTHGKTHTSSTRAAQRRSC